jgi:hypothetical protein
VFDLTNFYNDFAYQSEQFQTVLGVYQDLVNSAGDLVEQVKNNTVIGKTETYRIYPVQRINADATLYSLQTLLEDPRVANKIGLVSLSMFERINKWQNDEISVADKVSALDTVKIYLELNAYRDFLGEASSRIVDFELYDDSEQRLIQGVDYVFQNNKIYIFGDYAASSSPFYLTLKNIAVDYGTPQALLGDRIGMSYDDKLTPNEYNEISQMLMLAALGGPTIKNIKYAVQQVTGFGEAEIFDKYTRNKLYQAMWKRYSMSPFDFVILFPEEYTADIDRLAILIKYLKMIKPAYTSFIVVLQAIYNDVYNKYMRLSDEYDRGIIRETPWEEIYDFALKVSDVFEPVTGITINNCYLNADAIVAKGRDFDGYISGTESYTVELALTDGEARINQFRLNTDAYTVLSDFRPVPVTEDETISTTFEETSSDALILSYADVLEQAFEDSSSEASSDINEDTISASFVDAIADKTFVTYDDISTLSPTDAEAGVHKETTADTATANKDDSIDTYSLSYGAETETFNGSMVDSEAISISGYYSDASSMSPTDVEAGTNREVTADTATLNKDDSVDLYSLSYGAETDTLNSSFSDSELMNLSSVNSDVASISPVDSFTGNEREITPDSYAGSKDDSYDAYNLSYGAESDIFNGSLSDSASMNLSSINNDVSSISPIDSFRDNNKESTPDSYAGVKDDSYDAYNLSYGADTDTYSFAKSDMGELMSISSSPMSDTYTQGVLDTYDAYHIGYAAEADIYSASKTDSHDMQTVIENAVESIYNNNDDTYSKAIILIGNDSQEIYAGVTESNVTIIVGTFSDTASITALDETVETVVTITEPHYRLGGTSRIGVDVRTDRIIDSVSYNY